MKNSMIALVMENRKISVRFDRRNGQVVSLYDKVHATEYVAQAALAGLFSIAAPPYYFLSRDQTLARSSLRALAGDRQRMVLEYAPLVEEQSGRAFPLRLTITATLAHDSPTVVWQAFLENNFRGKAMLVESMDFPCIGGLRVKRHKLTVPIATGFIMEDPPATLPKHRYYAVDYPCYASMQWLDYYRDQCGLYLGCHDAAAAVKRICLEWNETADRQAAGISLYFTLYPWIKNRQSWQSCECLTSLHSGDWHAGADIYGAWARPLFPAADAPERMKSEPGFWSFPMMNNAVGNRTMKMTHKELASVYSAVKNLGCNNLWIYNALGKCLRNETEADLSQHDQGKEELRRILKKIQRLGARAIACLCFRLMPPTKAFRAEAVQSDTGAVCRETWGGGEEVYIMCPASRKWREKMKASVRLYLAEYGFDGLYLDQSMAQVPQLCRNKGHRHQNPARDWSRDDRRFLRELRQTARQINPQAYFTGEHIVDAGARYIDSNLCQTGFGGGLIEEQAERPAPLSEWQSLLGMTSNISIYRYTFPNHITCGGSVNFFTKGVNWRQRLNKCFLHGMQFFWYSTSVCLRDTDFLNLPPAITDYFKFYADLWRKVYPFFTDGRYLDNQGLTVKEKTIRAIMYAKGNTLLIALWNTTEKDRRAAVTVSGGIFRGRRVDSITDMTSGLTLDAAGEGFNIKVKANGINAAKIVLRE